MLLLLTEEWICSFLMLVQGGLSMRWLSFRWMKMWLIFWAHFIEGSISEVGI